MGHRHSTPFPGDKWSITIPPPDVTKFLVQPDGGAPPPVLPSDTCDEAGNSSADAKSILGVQKWVQTQSDAYVAAQGAEKCVVLRQESHNIAIKHEVARLSVCLDKGSDYWTYADWSNLNDTLNVFVDACGKDKETGKPKDRFGGMRHLGVTRVWDPDSKKQSGDNSSGKRNMYLVVENAPCDAYNCVIDANWDQSNIGGDERLR